MNNDLFIPKGISNNLFWKYLELKQMLIMIHYEIDILLAEHIQHKNLWPIYFDEMNWLSCIIIFFWTI